MSVISLKCELLCFWIARVFYVHFSCINDYCCNDDYRSSLVQAWVTQLFVYCDNVLISACNAQECHYTNMHERIIGMYKYVVIYTFSVSFIM